MAVYRTKFERINFDFDPPLRQTADVVFELDIEDLNPDIREHWVAADDAAWDACVKQNPHWFDNKHNKPIEGYAGWSSVLTAGDGFEKVVDKDLDFDLGTPGEGKPRLCETFVEKNPDKYSKNNSWRVTSFYKTFVPPTDKSPVDELIAEIKAEEYANMNAEERARKDKEYKVVQCSREEAEFIGGAGIAGTIRRIEDIIITGRVEWEDRTIARHRRDYRIHDDGWPTTIYKYWD
jgi:hypothetical protein